jgi:hypothetical protein
MSDRLFDGIVQIALAIVGIAILAVLVSRNAQTPQVIGAAGKAFAQDIGAAVSPVTGGSLGATGGYLPDLNY